MNDRSMKEDYVVGVTSSSRCYYGMVIITIILIKMIYRYMCIS